MARLIYDPAAKQEIKEAARYYELCRKGLGKKFLASVESAVANISLHPNFYRILRGKLRRCLITGFPYGILYISSKSEIYIIAVMHLRRKPGYWLKRIP